MTSRERVMAAISHQEPDRVPVDLGATIMSGIMAVALDRLRRHLGLEDRPVRVTEVFQMLGEVEPDVAETLGVDVLPVEPPVLYFGLRRDRHKPWQLFDGTEVLMPAQFDVEVNSKGDWLLHREGDPAQPVEGRMPKNGYYFDILSRLEFSDDYTPPDIDDLRRAREGVITDEALAFLQARARHLRRHTDKAVLLGCWGSLGLPWVGSIPNFLCLLSTDRGYVRDLFAFRTEVALENMRRLWEAVGEDADILGLDGADFGTQRCEQFSPEIFAELFAPFYRMQNEWVHRHTTWKTWKHSCGSIPRIVPYLVETGFDALNPVQCSAAGMEPRWLKESFGQRLTFWGGGVDTQWTLPFGTPEDVEREVRERIAVFAPGGGFVFNPVHNIQQGTPPENIVAAFRTVREAGRYPIAAGAHESSAPKGR